MSELRVMRTAWLYKRGLAIGDQLCRGDLTQQINKYGKVKEMITSQLSVPEALTSDAPALVTDGKTYIIPSEQQNVAGFRVIYRAARNSFELFTKSVSISTRI
jgi:hypothetical protein